MTNFGWFWGSSWHHMTRVQLSSDGAACACAADRRIWRPTRTLPSNNAENVALDAWYCGGCGVYMECVMQKILRCWTYDTLYLRSLKQNQLFDDYSGSYMRIQCSYPMSLRLITVRLHITWRYLDFFSVLVASSSTTFHYSLDSSTQLGDAEATAVNTLPRWIPMPPMPFRCHGLFLYGKFSECVDGFYPTMVSSAKKRRHVDCIWLYNLWYIYIYISIHIQTTCMCIGDICFFLGNYLCILGRNWGDHWDSFS